MLFRSRTHEGTGIGLSLVKELVKLHAGRITANSEIGQGTTMTVLIPRGSAHLDAERVIAPRAAAPCRAGLHPFVEEALGWLPDGEPVNTEAADAHPANILVVDDNADMRKYLCRLLNERWTARGAPDGLSALASIQRDPPDLVIADVMMPRLDGFGLLRALRSDAATSQVPVMLLSARAGEEAATEGLQAGADD